MAKLELLVLRHPLAALAFVANILVLAALLRYRSLRGGIAPSAVDEPRTLGELLGVAK